MSNTEILVKLKKLGVPLSGYQWGHYPRTHGKATGGDLKVIAHAFHELLRLRGKLMRSRADLPEEPAPPP